MNIFFIPVNIFRITAISFWTNFWVRILKMGWITFSKSIFQRFLLEIHPTTMLSQQYDFFLFSYGRWAYFLKIKQEKGIFVIYKCLFKEFEAYIGCWSNFNVFPGWKLSNFVIFKNSKCGAMNNLRSKKALCFFFHLCVPSSWMKIMKFHLHLCQNVSILPHISNRKKKGTKTRKGNRGILIWRVHWTISKQFFKINTGLSENCTTQISVMTRAKRSRNWWKCWRQVV